MRPLFFSLLSALVLIAGAARAEMPVTTDSRIKTFVFNANEVYTITTHYGYQSNIEFGDKESIETVSIGDRVAWQIIPAGRRLFIRAMEENAHTNMTIVTNLRAYQFDLRSSAADATFGSEELTYVVRFYYPGEGGAMPVRPASYMPPAPAMPAAPAMPSTAVLTTPAPTMAYTAKPAPTSSVTPLVPSPYTPVATGSIPVSAPAPAGNYNYKYTYSGPSNAAPVKIYDDGRSTYFKYRGPVTPSVSVITAKGEQLAVPVRNVGDNVVAVDIVAPRFSLNQAGGQVIVYNETNG